MFLPREFASFLRENNEIILASLMAACFVLLIGFLWAISRLGRLNRLYRRLTRGTSGGNLEEILQEYMNTVSDAEKRMTVVENRTERTDTGLDHCLQRIGLVRFDAFEEVGGEQSFAVALMDGRHNGITISSVYSRADVRVYAKAIHEGQPSHPLTREEQQAVAMAEGR